MKKRIALLSLSALFAFATFTVAQDNTKKADCKGEKKVECKSECKGEKKAECTKTEKKSDCKGEKKAECTKTEKKADCKK
jgi:hypothetical protein